MAELARATEAKEQAEQHVQTANRKLAEMCQAESEAKKQLEQLQDEAAREVLADEAARELLQHFGRLADAIPIEGASSEVQQLVQQVRRIPSRPPSTAPPQRKLKLKKGKLFMKS